MRCEVTGNKELIKWSLTKREECPPGGMVMQTHQSTLRSLEREERRKEGREERERRRKGWDG
jgi:hypothetical protein